MSGMRPLFLPSLLLASFLLLQPHSVSGATGRQNANTPAAATAGLHPVIIELFTSEGCSTCPPADALIQKLDANQPVEGAQIIVMSEHVNYWDHDGWKDPNSSDLLTARQGDYEASLRQGEPYTPQIIVDGTKEVRIDNPRQIEDVLRAAQTVPKIPMRIGEVTIDGGVLKTHIETDANSSKQGAEIYLAVALDHVESQVLHGENGGKHLVHVAVVQELTKIGKLPKGKTFSQDVQVKLKAGTDPANLRVIAFVQEYGLGKMLGAAMRKPNGPKGAPASQ